MRRVLVLAALVAGTLTLSGCPKKPSGGECKTSADCADQAGFGKVCVQGRCQECGADGDCKAGFVCRDNACVPKPQCDETTPCPAGQVCQAGACVRDPNACAGDLDCGPGRRCEAGRCVTGERATGPVTPAVPPECADPAAFTIRFGFDQSVVTDAARGTLQKLADCLKAAPARKVTVAGHADDRGGTQYNLALGERRAESARKYLSDLGAGGEMSVVSFGEEKPVCEEQSEACWERNRRAEFEIAR
jgi:peptidoglycan-associated lipoprotein